MNPTRIMAEELVTQDKIDVLNQMANSSISREVGVAFIEQMLELGHITTLLQARTELERVVKSNFDNLTRLATQAVESSVATSEELAAIVAARQSLSTAFNLEPKKNDVELMEGIENDITRN